MALAGNIEGLPDQIDHRQLFEERFVVLTAADGPLASLRQIPIDFIGGSRLGGAYRVRSCEAFLASVFPSGRRAKDWLSRSTGEPSAAHGRGGTRGHARSEHAPHLPTLVAREIAGDPLRREVQLLVVAGRRYSPALDAFVKIARLRDWRGDLHDARPLFAEMDRETRPPRRPSCPGRPAHAGIKVRVTAADLQ